DAEVRIDARPRIRRRLAAIIKARPDETPGEPRTVGKPAPPGFSALRPLMRRLIVSNDIAARRIFFVYATRARGAGLLRADVRLIRMFGVIRVHVRAGMIIPAAHFDDAIDAPKTVAFRRGVGHGAGRVKTLDVVLHRARGVGALR